MELDKFIKHTFRLLPIYEQAQKDEDYSNYVQTIDYNLSEMEPYAENETIIKVCGCLNELRDINAYQHFNVKKIVLYCCKLLNLLKSR